MTTTEKHRILVTVKTYPTLSTKYGETVCTAGVREDGTWVRIYPVPFRRLGEAEQYRKFDWIECRLKRRDRDPRPESFSPVDFGELTPVGHVGTSDRWNERRRLLLKTATVYDTLSEPIAAAKGNVASLAVFKPTRVTDFIWEDDDREWSQHRLDQMRALHTSFPCLRRVLGVKPSNSSRSYPTPSPIDSRMQPDDPANSRFWTGRSAPSTGTA